MALTRNFLTGLEIEADKIDQIIKAHAETVDALKSEIAEQKRTVEEQKKNITELSKLQSELDAVKAEKDKIAKENVTLSDYKEKYEEANTNLSKVTKEFEDYKTNVKDKETKNNKTAEYRRILAQAGVSDKRIDSIIKVSASEIDSIDFDKDGKIKNSDELVEKAKTDWADFIDQKSVVGASTPTPPANNGGNTMTKEDIMKIKDRNERQKAISENHELFGY